MNPIKIVITGGPSGGKTTLIDVITKDLPGKVSVVPEAASILYRGGFPRRATILGKKHAQRAICFVQRELEDLVTAENKVNAIICDRGSLDSIAYWPGDDDDFFSSLRTTRDIELSRYNWVLHLDTPDIDGYDHSNTIRTENHKEAVELNSLIKEAWQGHPQRIIISHASDFLVKMAKAKQAIQLILNGAKFNEIQIQISR